jgi:hypothetical protein
MVKVSAKEEEMSLEVEEGEEAHILQELCLNKAHTSVQAEVDPNLPLTCGHLK